MAGSSSHGIAAAGAGSRLVIHHSRISDNGGNAIGLSDGAELHSVGLHAQRNLGYALRLSNSTASIQGAWFTGNFGGIRNESSSLELRDSLIADSTGATGGVGIHQAGGSLTLLNSTITRNVGPGVNLVSGAYSIANNIFYQNGEELRASIASPLSPI